MEIITQITRHWLEMRVVGKVHGVHVCRTKVLWFTLVACHSKQIKTDGKEQKVE